MARYRKRIIPTVTASQWSHTEDHARVIKRGVNDTPMVWGERSGWQLVCKGDWIVSDGMGGHFPCAPEIFESIYEKVEDSE